MIKILAIAILCSIVIIYLKSVNSEFTTIAMITSGILLLGYSLTYIDALRYVINKLSDIGGFSSENIKIVLKIVGMGYLIEFTAGTIEDFGLKSLADKLVFVGKLMIISVAIPTFYSMFNLLTSLI